VSSAGRHAFLTISLISVLSCAGKPGFSIAPGYESARIDTVILMPATGIPAEISDRLIRKMAEIIGETDIFKMELYTTGQYPSLDDALVLARKVDGAIPVNLTLDAAKSVGADAVLVAHQLTLVPEKVVAYKHETETGARIRTATSLPKPSNRDLEGGLKPVSITFPSGLLGLRLYEVSTRQILWEVKREISNTEELTDLLRRIPAQ
jgi:hypothetical protein